LLSIVLIIVYERIYLLGGYGYTRDQLCAFFEENHGLTLKRPAIAVQATHCLKQQGLPYRVKACMYNNEPLFMFVAMYRPTLTPTITFTFEENEDARVMKETLKLHGAPFLTAIY
jgi:hypothetical protein